MTRTGWKWPAFALPKRAEAIPKVKAVAKRSAGPIAEPSPVKPTVTEIPVSASSSNEQDRSSRFQRAKDRKG
jgi:hypothetical protein